MDWSNERYVRLYTRDSADMISVRWEGRLVLYELLRKVDRAGVLDHGGDIDLLPELLRIPADIFTTGLERLRARDVVTVTERGIVIRNFLEAQDASWTDAQRKRESRARHRDIAMRPPLLLAAVSPMTQESLKCHETGRPVTKPDAGVRKADKMSRRVLPDDPDDPDKPDDLASEVSDPGPPKPKKAPPTEAIQVAESIAKHVLERDPGSSKLRNPETRKRTIASWADSIRLLHERDGRPWPLIAEVWRWARADERFWAGNVLSGQTLRKQFDRLVVDMKRPTNGHGPRRPAPQQTRLAQDWGRWDDPAPAAAGDDE